MQFSYIAYVAIRMLRSIILRRRDINLGLLTGAFVVPKRWGFHRLIAVGPGSGLGNPGIVILIGLLRRLTKSAKAKRRNYSGQKQMAAKTHKPILDQSRVAFYNNENQLGKLHLCRDT